jgi:hypothetical protein
MVTVHVEPAGLDVEVGEGETVRQKNAREKSRGQRPIALPLNIPQSNQSSH